MGRKAQVKRSPEEKWEILQEGQRIPAGGRRKAFQMDRGIVAFM